MDLPLKMRLMVTLNKYGRINPSQKFMSEPMLFFILKNASPRLYFKLLQVSKYFLVKEPPKGLYSLNKLSNNFSPGRYIYGKNFCILDSRHELEASFLIKNISFCKITQLQLEGQKLTFNELKLILTDNKVEYLNLVSNSISHSNGEAVDLEDILAYTPALVDLHYHSESSFNFKLEKLVTLPKLVKFHLRDLKESFNVHTFFQYFQTYQHTKLCFVLAFRQNIYKAYFRTFINQILQLLDNNKIDTFVRHTDTDIVVGDYYPSPWFFV